MKNASAALALFAITAALFVVAGGCGVKGYPLPPEQTPEARAVTPKPSPTPSVTPSGTPQATKKKKTR